MHPYTHTSIHVLTYTLTHWDAKKAITGEACHAYVYVLADLIDARLPGWLWVG